MAFSVSSTLDRTTSSTWPCNGLSSNLDRAAQLLGGIVAHGGLLFGLVLVGWHLPLNQTEATSPKVRKKRYVIARSSSMASCLSRSARTSAAAGFRLSPESTYAPYCDGVKTPVCSATSAIHSASRPAPAEGRELVGAVLQRRDRDGARCLRGGARRHPVTSARSPRKYVMRMPIGFTIHQLGIDRL